MDLAPAPDQRELQESARRFLQKEVTRERLLAWDRTAEGYDPAFWSAVAGLGWIGLSLPEEYGGGGASLLEAALLFEECGRGLAPPAIHAAVVGARALAALGGPTTKQILAAVIRGERQVALATHEPDGSRDFSAFRTRLQNGRLSGEKAFVRQGASADHLIVAARDGEMPAFVLVPAAAAGVSRRELRTFGG
ncbi:MAG: acyl-CoA dehydrogenase family protein, partial [Candidatus Binatia bacterium]